MAVKIKADQVGEYNADGSVKSRPARFVNGRDIPRERASGVTAFGIGDNRFVALPTGYSGELVFEITPADSGEPAVEAPAPAETSAPIFRARPTKGE